MTQAARSFSLGGSSRTGLLLAGALAAVTGILIFVALQSGNDDGGTKSVSGGAETAVVVAKLNIPARTAIQADMVEVVRVPSNALLGGAFSSSDLAVGRVARIQSTRANSSFKINWPRRRQSWGFRTSSPKGTSAWR